MKLLVITQAVDIDDPVLGFFHGWLAAFAKEFETIEVICLKEGSHTLRENVAVHSLGKERLKIGNWKLKILTRFLYIVRLYRTLWRLRGRYDVVFVHMNQEYVLLGAFLWRALGKRVALWRNHHTGSRWTRIAGRLAHIVCYTSPSAYVAPFKNGAQMPIGIDTEIFKPLAQVAPAHTILMLGRLDPMKQVHLFIDALEVLRSRGIFFTADVYGEPTEGNEGYAHEVRNRAGVLALDGSVAFHGSVNNRAAPAVYAAHAVYVNLSPSGSFDKTIGEAMACGCLVVTGNDAVTDIVPPQLFVRTEAVEAIADALQCALSLGPAERTALAQNQQRYIRERHALVGLAKRLSHILTV
jgi:glycosyltransferase involved in cell wall biosynthesis